jgi:2-polyprenyl-3-methyl-5-hydroxy-6-metoxy-1,4-benzoquinol methylase
MPSKTSTAPPRLRIDPSFVLAHTLDGRPFVAKDAEPYTQFWLSEREHGLLMHFSGRRGASSEEAAAAFLRMKGIAGTADGTAERQRIHKAVRGMQAAGVLVPCAQDTSRYSAAIADDYIANRPFPQPLAQHIIERGRVHTHSRVLDLAGGPGDLALALARASRHVSLMELSRGFLATAQRRAQTLGVPLQTVHDSCNRLLHHEGRYDVVTVSQALHWLDDVAVVRGLVRLLQAGGSFFVVHSAMQVPDTHPLAHLLGYDSILGAHPRQPFADEVRPLLRRLALLFEALDTPGVQRFDADGAAASAGAVQRIAPAAVTLFRQPRPFGPGYARGFFTPQHIAVSGLAPEAFWRDLHARCAARPDADCMGTQHWAVLHFQRGAQGLADPGWAERPALELGFDGPG